MVDIVADIGGTNARFACYRPAGGQTRPGRLEHILTLRVDDFPSLEDALAHYCAHIKQKPRRLSCAIAGPVDQEQVKLSNNSWSFSKTGLKTASRTDTLTIINDFTAQALLPPYLTEQDKQLIRPGQPHDKTPIAVLGPGTGLGFSSLIPVGENQWKPLETEGGNIWFAPRTEQDAALRAFIRAEKGADASFEDVLSGRGLEAIYRFCTDNRDTQTAAQISALASTDDLAKKAVIIFLNCLASYVSTAILMTGARQGVFLSGGILPRLTAYFASSDFDSRLDDHNSYSDYVGAVPVYLITAADPGLLGAGLALSNPFLDHRRC